jgi:hypothetical protein
LGAGVKAWAGTSNRSRTSLSHWVMTVSRPKSLLPGCPARRWATSFWNIRVRLVRQPGSSAIRPSQASSRTVETLYGRLATKCRGASPRAVTSSLCASPSITVRRPGKWLAKSSRAGRQRRSFSIAITCRAPAASRARVRPPGPGPTSIVVPWLRSPAARAMRAVRLRSRR